MELFLLNNFIYIFFFILFLQWARISVQHFLKSNHTLSWQRLGFSNMPSPSWVLYSFRFLSNLKYTLTPGRNQQTSSKTLIDVSKSAISYILNIYLIIWLYFFNSYTLGINLPFYTDGLSLIFILLIVIIAPLCLFWVWFTPSFNKAYQFIYLFFITVLIFCFLVKNFFWFFFLFECLLIPMFILIGFWGPRGRKIKAAYLLVMYTIVGSIFLLLALFIYYLEGLGFYDISSPFQILMQHTNLPFSKQIILWLCLFIGFAIKVPLFPVHIWLPEAHVEAPTIGSVLLAAFLLKLGLYGLIRFTIVPLFNVTVYFTPFVYILALVGTVFAALTALRQIDFKKVIAYSSVSHMNFCVLGLFSYNLEGLVGACIVMIGHGFISGALFFLIGSLYDRYHSKLLLYYGGLKQVMPVFAFFFFFFTLANISFPGTVNFIGEGLILLGLVKNIFSLYLISSLGVFFTTAFSVLKFNQLVLGSLQTKHIAKFQDLTKREVCCLLPLTFFTVLLGIFPEIILEPTAAYFKVIDFTIVSGV